MKYSYTEYRNALKQARDKGLPQENYFMYVETNGGAIEFTAVEKKRAGWIGYFVEDDDRIQGTINVAVKRVKNK